MEEVFEQTVENHTGGCPVVGVRWTYLTIEEIRSKLKDHGIPLCREVIYRLLRTLCLGRRKMSKQVIMKEVKGRDEQFNKIAALKRFYLSRGYAVLSIDTKKKEFLGPFYRSGAVYGDGPLRCYDHDFNSFATGKIVPYGIYDLGRNEGHMYIGNSKDTAEFVGLCLRTWWKRKGRKIYDPSQPILLLADGGGSNASRSHLFKEQLQLFSSETGLVIRVAHYPSYCSKYNPIEHRLFPTITRVWAGVMLDSAGTAIELIRQRTKKLKSGLRVHVRAINKTFEKGKKVAKDFWKNANIKFDAKCKKWNYRVFPIP